GRATVEHADRSYPFLVIPAELQPIPQVYRSREHPNISDLLAGRTAFDLEHSARNRPIRIAFGAGTLWVEQLFDTIDPRLHPSARDCRAEEHRMHQRLLGLCRKLAMQLAV